MKLNVGCGNNRLEGWNNVDMSMDISKPLPLEDESVEFIFAEHVLEHVTPIEAFNFLQESKRVLITGGAIRIIVPSIEQLVKNRESSFFDSYCQYYARRGWIKEKTLPEVCKSILGGHYHKSTWTTESLKFMFDILQYSNFYKEDLFNSSYSEFVNICGHHKVVGKEVFEFEAICIEAVK